MSSWQSVVQELPVLAGTTYKAVLSTLNFGLIVISVTASQQVERRPNVLFVFLLSFSVFYTVFSCAC